MADETTFVNGKSREEIAYMLMRDIASLENRGMYANHDSPADRKWILNTMADCVRATKGQGVS